MESSRSPKTSGPRPIDRLLGVYAVVAALALLFPHRPQGWPLLASVHLGACWLLFRLPPVPALLRKTRQAIPKLGPLLGDWYPLLLIPLLYKELQTLNRAIYDGQYFDPLIIAWEAALFGGQPSRELAAAWPFPWLSETLHGAYLAYYLVIFGPPLYLYLRRRLEAFRTMVFTVMFTFVVFYLFFIYFPVQGPRYLFPAPGGAIADGTLYRLSHAILEAGSSQGAAFPSSHAGVALAQTILAIRYMPRWAPLIGAITLGIALGSVYGGFHYAIDAVLGLALGAVLAAAAPAVHRRMMRS